MTTTEHEHTHITAAEDAPDKGKRKQFRAYIDSPEYLDDHGRRTPKILAGGSKEHCEQAIKAYRQKNFRATQWPAKVVEVIEPGKDPKVSFE